MEEVKIQSPVFNCKQFSHSGHSSVFIRIVCMCVCVFSHIMNQTLPFPMHMLGSDDPSVTTHTHTCYELIDCDEK